MSIRLPLANYERLTNQAASGGLTPIQQATELLVAATDEPPAALVGVPTTCVHPTRRRSTINGGLKQCRDCGAIRQVNGTWA